MAHSFGDFARDLTAVTVLYESHMHKVMNDIGKMVEEEARDVIGTYRYGWPQLAQSTQEERARLGYPANEPLLREGDLRESISHEVVSHEHAVDIGSESKIAAYQELGTSRIPPRSFLRMAAEAKEPEIVEEIGGRVHIAMLEGLKLIP